MLIFHTQPGSAIYSLPPRGWQSTLGWDFKQVQMLKGCELRAEKLGGFAFLLSSCCLYIEEKGQVHNSSQDSTSVSLSELQVFNCRAGGIAHTSCRSLLPRGILAANGCKTHGEWRCLWEVLGSSVRQQWDCLRESLSA